MYKCRTFISRIESLKCPCSCTCRHVLCTAIYILSISSSSAFSSNERLHQPVDNYITVWGSGKKTKTPTNTIDLDIIYKWGWPWHSEWQLCQKFRSCCHIAPVGEWFPSFMAVGKKDNCWYILWRLDLWELFWRCPVPWVCVWMGGGWNQFGELCMHQLGLGCSVGFWQINGGGEGLQSVFERCRLQSVFELHASNWSISTWTWLQLLMVLTDYGRGGGGGGGGRAGICLVYYMHQHALDCSVGFWQLIVESLVAFQFIIIYLLLLYW